METTPALVRCPRCQRNLDPICFYKDRSKSSGRKSHCRNCTKTACRKWKRENPEKVAAYKAEERRVRRDARLARRDLKDFYEAESEALDRRQMIDLFGPDYESQGIHLTNKRSTKIPSGSPGLAQEIEDVYELLSEDLKSHYVNQHEIANTAVMFQLLGLLFPYC